MGSHDHRGAWLLLDPPSASGYARRGSLREKDNAPDAPFPSIDLVLLSGAVREAGFSPVFVDAQIDGWTWERVCEEAPRIDAKGVVSLLSSSRIDEELAALRALKQALSGGPVYAVASVYLALNPQRYSAVLEAHPWLDGLILNTAENNFANVITQSEAAPCNVAVRKNGVVLTPPMGVNYGEGLRIPQPQHSIFKDARYYFPQTKRVPVTCVQMSFGCPFTCEFCLDNALYRKMLYRDTDDVVEELSEVDRLGFREVYFKDLTFGLNKRITTDFLDKLTKRHLKLRWLCTTRMDVATPRLLTQMKRAGCYGIEFGVESGVRHRREANGKPISDDKVREVFDQCRRLGIETTALVIIGFEDETEAEIRTTMSFIMSLRPDYVSYNILNALPGTELERRARREGFLQGGKSDHAFVDSNIKSRYLTPERLVALRSEAMRSFYRRTSTALLRLSRLRSAFELKKLVRLSRVAM